MALSLNFKKISNELNNLEHNFSATAVNQNISSMGYFSESSVTKSGSVYHARSFSSKTKILRDSCVIVWYNEGV